MLRLSTPHTRPRHRTRRELVLRSVNVAVVGALFQIGATPRPDTLGVQDYGSGVKALGLCPKSPNCISTSEEANDLSHYVPSWQYNPEDGRAMKKPASQAQAMQELVDTVNELKPDKFEPKIITRTDDYLYVEYESPTFGFIDDVEFWFPSDKCAPHRQPSHCCDARVWICCVVVRGGGMPASLSKRPKPALAAWHSRGAFWWGWLT